jgi:hypothetical protein
VSTSQRRGERVKDEQTAAPQTELYAQTLRTILSYDRKAIKTESSKCGNCAVIAVIKDQAAYVHEFIHHYLHFGFHKIVLLVNRTTDATVDIATQISHRYPQVICQSIDWIDALGLSGRIQSLGYAYGIWLLRQQAEVENVLLCDGDEFWFPSDFSSSISDFIQRYDAFDQLSFCWAKQISKEAAFRPPFENRSISLAPQIKSVLALDKPIRAPRIHTHLFRGTSIHLGPDGLPFNAEPERQERYAGDLGNHAAYVLHRMQRSETEYMALLAQGNPEGRGRNNVELSAEQTGTKAYMVKANRAGYLDESTGQLPPVDDAYRDYHRSLALFCEDCGINNQLNLAREGIKIQAYEIEKALESYLSKCQRPFGEEARKVLKVIRGTHLARGLSR